MKRFMGIMPSSCIEISQDYKDDNGMNVHIDAGSEGWTVMYADGSTEYEDIKGSAKENFERAYKVASENLNLTIVVDIDNCEVLDDDNKDEFDEEFEE